MINRKSRDEIKRMIHAGHIVALVHQKMKEVLEPGISTKELDNYAMQVIKENRAVPTFLGYNGFPASICTSINEHVVHGIPSEKEILKEGDIIAIDVGATYGGMVGDSAWSYEVGKVSDDVHKLIRAKVLFAGVFYCINDIRYQHKDNDYRAKNVDPSKFHSFTLSDSDLTRSPHLDQSTDSISQQSSFFPSNNSCSGRNPIILNPAFSYARIALWLFL